MNIDTAEMHPTFLVEDEARKILGDSGLPAVGYQVELEGRIYQIGQIGLAEGSALKHLALTIMNGSADMVKAPLPAWAEAANS